MSDSSAEHSELIRRAQHGDALAFADLVQGLSVRLLCFLRRTAGRSVGGDADEEDMMQIVLAQGWRLLPTFEDRGPEAFYRWLVAIARHTIGDRLKYIDAKGRAEMAGRATDSAWSQIADSLTPVTRAAMRREAWENLEKALAGLNERHSIVVTLHLLEGKTLGEIGAQLGITKNAVWERLRHGLAALREQIGSPTP